MHLCIFQSSWFLSAAMGKCPHPQCFVSERNASSWHVCFPLSPILLSVQAAGPKEQKAGHGNIKAVQEKTCLLLSMSAPNDPRPDMLVFSLLRGVHCKSMSLNMILTTKAGLVLPPTGPAAALGLAAGRGKEGGRLRLLWMSVSPTDPVAAASSSAIWQPCPSL